MKKALWLCEREVSLADNEILIDYLIINLKQLNSVLYEKIYIKNDLNALFELLTSVSKDDKFELIALFENPYRLFVFTNFIYINMLPFENKLFYIDGKIVSLSEVRRQIMNYIIRFQ